MFSSLSLRSFFHISFKTFLVFITAMVITLSPKEIKADLNDEQLSQAVLFDAKATLNVKKGNYKEAIQYLDKLINLTGWAYAYQNRGYAKAKLGFYYEALADLNKSIEIDPNASDVFVFRSIIKDSLDDLKGACDDARQSILLGNNKLNKWVDIKC